VGIEPARYLWLMSYFDKENSNDKNRRHCFRISAISDYVRVLFYADDLKLFLTVKGFQDCMKIQSDQNKLS
jgi:hypothetical protein